MSGLFRITLLIVAAVATVTLVGWYEASAQKTDPVAALMEAWKASPHANAESESFKHWDKDKAVPVVCATCHSGAGFRDFLGADGSAPGKVDKPAAIRSVVGCDTCHNDKANALTSVAFPSGVTVGNLDGSARCMVCHQGRQAGADVSRAVAGIAPDTPSDKLSFINVHYRAAAATLYGSQAKGGFEYPGKTYHGKFAHPASADSCIDCHDPHSTKVKASSCGACHKGGDLRAIRMKPTDYDGDKDSAEGIAGEIATMHEALGKAIVAYAKAVGGSPIAYDAHSYPYFFNDTNGNGIADKSEAVRTNGYKKWTPRLLQAAYNYQFVAKDPGLYAHNPVYGLQLLYDSIESLSAKSAVPALSAMRRP